MKKKYTYILGLFASGVVFANFSNSLDWNSKEWIEKSLNISSVYFTDSSVAEQSVGTQLTQQKKVAETILSNEYLNVQTPNNIQVKLQNGLFVITWDVAQNVNGWELVVQQKNSGVPTNDNENIVFVSNPNYTFSHQRDVDYEVYVRAIDTNEVRSAWSTPVAFSDFVPEACAKLTLNDISLNANSSGDYVICPGQSNEVHLSADFDAEHFKATSTYEVEEIEYNPPYPFLGGNIMSITSDDDYTASFNLPFDFCFFENKYSYCRIGDNGVITFGLPFTEVEGEYCPWTINAPIPNQNTSIKNAIYGVFQDMYTTNNPGPNSQINYQVIGEYPCRALVVNFNEVPAYNTECNSPQFRTTTQVVLYEITNIIEVYVKQRNACNAWQNGNGVLGIQNEQGTLAYTPPGRNTGNWNAQEEAWRFKPSGDTTVEFAWYANGVLISNEKDIDFTVTNPSTVIEARLTFEDCGQELVLSETFNIKMLEEFDLPSIPDVQLCVYENEFPNYNLETFIPHVTQNLTNASEYSVEFYRSQADAENGQNRIANPTVYSVNPIPQTVYIKVVHNQTECFGIRPVNFVPAPVPAMAQPENVVICNSFVLPELPDPLFSYHEIKQIEPISGAIIDVKNDVPAGNVLPIGNYVVKIKLLSDLNCEAFIEYNVEVQPCDLPKGISPNGDGKNDQLDLTNYRSLKVTIYNRYGKVVYEHGLGYTNQWKGQDLSGGDLPSGTYFLEVQTMTTQFTSWIELSR